MCVFVSVFLCVNACVSWLDEKSSAKYFNVTAGTGRRTLTLQTSLQ